MIGVALLLLVDNNPVAVPFQPCHDPEFESKHVTAAALPWQSRRSWQRKVHFPGFLALPEIFQASGHLIPGPRIPFPAKGELNIEEKQKVMAETSNLTSGARCIRDMRNMLDLELQNALFTRI